MIANIFGQIFAKQQRLRVEARISSINREISKITKNISRMERQANQEKRAKINNAKQQFSIFTTPNIQAGVIAKMKADPLMKDFFNADGTLNLNDQNVFNQFNQEVANQRTVTNNQLQAQLDQIDEEYEQFQEITIQALKDENEDLEAEKATLTAQKDIYKGMEDQEKQFAQENIKGMFQA